MSKITLDSLQQLNSKYVSKDKYNKSVNYEDGKILLNTLKLENEELFGYSIFTTTIPSNQHFPTINSENTVTNKFYYEIKRRGSLSMENGFYLFTDFKSCIFNFLSTFYFKNKRDFDNKKSDIKKYKIFKCSIDLNKISHNNIFPLSLFSEEDFIKKTLTSRLNYYSVLSSIPYKYYNSGIGVYSKTITVNSLEKADIINVSKYEKEFTK